MLIQNADGFRTLHGVAVARSIRRGLVVASKEGDVGQKASIGWLDLAGRRSFKVALEWEACPKGPEHADDTPDALPNALTGLAKVLNRRTRIAQQSSQSQRGSFR